MKPEVQERHYRKVINDKPGLVRPRLQLASVLIELKRFDESIKVIDGAMKIAPGNVRGFTMRANVLARMGRSREAAKTAMNAMKQVPESINVYLLAAHMQLADLQPAKAQRLLDEALELDPGVRHLKKMHTLQSKVNRLTQRAEHDPLNWFASRLKKRLVNVASED